MTHPESDASVESFAARARAWLDEHRADAPPDWGPIMPPERRDEGMAWQRKIHDAGFAGIQRGRDAALEKGMGTFLRGVPDLQIELRGEPIVGVDAVAWEWTFTGTNTGTWGGIPATNQRIQLKGFSLMRLRGGKIVQLSSYYDTGTLNRQLGL